MQGRFPVKSCEFVLNLLKNAESNAEARGLDVESLIVNHIQVCLLAAPCGVSTGHSVAQPLQIATCSHRPSRCWWPPCSPQDTYSSHRPPISPEGACVSGSKNAAQCAF